MSKIESLGKIDIVNHKSESGIIKLLSLLSGAVGIKEFKDKEDNFNIKACNAYKVFSPDSLSQAIYALIKGFEINLEKLVVEKLISTLDLFNCSSKLQTIKKEK